MFSDVDCASCKRTQKSAARGVHRARGLRATSEGMYLYWSSLTDQSMNAKCGWTLKCPLRDFRVEFAVGLIQPDELHDEGELGHPALTHYQRRQRQRRQSKMQTEEMFVECEQSEEEEEEIVEECRRSKFQCSEGGECCYTWLVTS